MSIKPGARLGKRYQLLSPIATGGMGQVWRAEDTTLHRVVAAKILRSEFTGDETFVKRFRAEAQNTASLSHPNIASVYDYGEQVHDAERLAYLVMELVEGEPLVDILARERRITPERTLDYLEQTATGLAAAHREGMVHRDVKPGNLIIRPDGVLKITDFGIARAANAAALTEQGTVVGTAQYLAPEQAEGKPARPASDIYALGVVGYECLAGVRPFDGDNSVAIALSQIRDTPRPLPPDVPAHVRRLIELTMTKNPDARYRDGDEYVRTVRAVRAGQAPAPAPFRPSQAPAAPVQLPGTPRPPGAPGPGVVPTGAPGHPGGPRPAGPPGTGRGPGGPVQPNRPPQQGPQNRPAAGPGGPSGRSGAYPQTGMPASPARRGQTPGTPPGAASPPTSRPGGIPKRWWWIATAIGAVLIIALIVTLVLTSGDGDDSEGMPPSGTASSAASSSSAESEPADPTDPTEADVTETGSEPGDVVLDSDKIVGRSLDYVLEGLTIIDYDLTVEVLYDGDPQEGDPGTVTSGKPFGTPIEPQQTITLHVVPDSAGAPTS